MKNTKGWEDTRMGGTGTGGALGARDVPIWIRHGDLETNGPGDKGMVSLSPCPSVSLSNKDISNPQYLILKHQFITHGIQQNCGISVYFATQNLF